MWIHVEKTGINDSELQSNTEELDSEGKTS